MFPPAQLLDPLRTVDGTRSARYDCPDLAALDRHIDRLRRHIADLGDRIPEVADGCRADIDRLLDRRSWLTLPVAAADDHRLPGRRGPGGPRPPDRACRTTVNGSRNVNT